MMGRNDALGVGRNVPRILRSTKTPEGKQPLGQYAQIYWDTASHQHRSECRSKKNTVLKNTAQKKITLKTG